MFCRKHLACFVILIIVSGGSLMVEAAEVSGFATPILYQQVSVHLQVYDPGFCSRRQSR